VYLPDDTGNVHIFEHGKEKKTLPSVDMATGVKAAAVFANGALYITTQTRLFATARQ
jgi:hypothetical protein